jgi:hypothetical protein
MNNAKSLNWTKSVNNGITKNIASTQEMTITIRKVKSKWVAVHRFNTKHLNPYKSTHKSKSDAMDCAFNFATSFMNSEIYQNAQSI